MDRLALIFQHLDAMADPSVDMAMAAALPTADHQARELIVAASLRRGRPEGLAGLVRSFAALEASQQQAVLQQLDAVAPLLQNVALAEDPEAQRNVLAMIRQARAVGLAHVVVEFLRRRSGELRREAAACLVDLTQAAAQAPLDDAGVGPEHRRALALAVEEAVTGYSHHHQPAVLVALLNLQPPPIGRLRQALSDPRHAALNALARLIEDADQPAVRRNLLALGLIPGLRHAVTTALRRVRQPAALNEVLSQAHLLAAPAVVTLLRKRGLTPGLTPDPERLEALSSQALRALPRWLDALGLEPVRRAHALSSLARCEDRGVRLAIVLRLLELTDSSAGEPELEALAGFCVDPDATVARLALRQLVRLQWSGLPRWLTRLVNSPHPEVRQLAGRHLAPLAFARFWESWPRLEPAQRSAAGKALVKIDPGFTRQLNEKLDRRERADRLRALAVIHALSQGPAFEGRLLRLLGERDLMVVSAAVRALGTVHSEQATAALERCLEHPDSRVRANAVEALDQLQSTRHLRKLLDMAQEDQARPRANAIRSLLSLRVRDALDALSRMLADARPRQRLSALWLVETMGLLDLARHVAELSLDDPDRQVRGRAEGVIQRLLAAAANVPRPRPPQPPAPAPAVAEAHA